MGKPWEILPRNAENSTFLWFDALGNVLKEIEKLCLVLKPASAIAKFLPGRSSKSSF